MMAATKLEPSFEHVSVMLEETLDALCVAPAGVYVDVTVGRAGHASALLERLPEARLFAFDRDPTAVVVASERLSRFGRRATVLHGSFLDVEARLAEADVSAVDGVLGDLGVSSPQLTEAERGMSFRHEGPLDMRMDPSSGETAFELIERLDQNELADVIYQYGEEHRSRRVARCIKQALDRRELHTTLDLRRAVVRATGPRRVGGVDPSTKTFQALRIAVNRELEQLEGLLAALPRIVRPGGVGAIISFHSLEDRLVKRAFLDRESWVRLSKKPVTAKDTELDENPRSRSAKLRAAMRGSGSHFSDSNELEPDSDPSPSYGGDLE